ncbi:MAG: radical SAM protein [Candidatus Lokiarchaeota archaeon]|nr:radical SAM protein [Candidatus Lokiarchaeota archaeon]MBD3200011.1 radical SAM protein [Candidatus Lokiarchaeota archaeon]
MKRNKIFEYKGTNYYFKKKGIPRGCQLCLKGVKTVFFLNGICQKPDHCAWYCPISNKRKNKQNSYANEILISSKEELMEEIKKAGSKGMSITGGEPLIKQNLEKTIDYITYIRKELGSKFHIHLYTNGLNFNEEIALRLSKAGLDEIRFHPPKEKWNNIRFALGKGLSVGAEVPLIPEDQYIRNLIEFICYLDKIGADFINLNEFEYCFPNSQSLKERGFQLQEGSIASVTKSREEAYKLLNDLIDKVSLKIHFCSIQAKDYYQLKNRYLRRAENIKKGYEVVTSEGLLVHGQIEGSSDEVERFYVYLKEISGVPKEMLSIHEGLLRIPYYLAIDKEFLELLNNYDLKGYILEVLPFREEKYRHICEQTPIETFIKETKNL